MISITGYIMFQNRDVVEITDQDKMIFTFSYITGLSPIRTGDRRNIME